MGAGGHASTVAELDQRRRNGVLTSAILRSVTVALAIVFDSIFLATALSLGTAMGGWRIMHTVDQRVVALEPIHGFAAETKAPTSACRSPPRT
jgi:PiT family inorganic phosphate transporter